MSERAVETRWMPLIAVACLWAPGAAQASGYDPYATVVRGPIEVDMSEAVASPGKFVAPPPEQPDFSKLGQAPVAAPQQPGKLPPGWVQIGEVVQREEVALGFKQVDPEPSAAWEDIEGNQYPRKHTLYLNFNGGVLYGGEDNSAENKSALARAGHPYPVYSKSESSALATIQAVKEDMSTLGVRVVYETRPSKTVPYTMVMVGGSWTDANLEEDAGGVAPGTDCEARGQRHVVYAFSTSSSTIGQEAAHAWGLDHTLGSDRIMSYQEGSNKRFGDNCQDLCELQCQGPGTIGCRMIHEKYCGEGSEQQNDLAELNFIFGTPVPDTSPPDVAITEPADGTKLEVGASITVTGDVHDDYGGVGWKLIVKHNGKAVFDAVDYDRRSSWFFSKLPEGIYEVTLEAEDHADHIVTDTITLTVGNPSGSSAGESEGTPTTSESDDGGEGGSSGEADASGSGSGSDSVGAEDSGGCRISPTGGAGPFGLLAPVLGLGLAWRARRRRA
jgi:MYXO-CTERM domain-containing protein